MKNIFWAIEDEKGEIVTAAFNYHNEGEVPVLYQDEEDAKNSCVDGERPVKVEVRKVEG